MHDALLVPTILAPSSHSACSLSSRSASGAMIHARTIAVRAILESETSNLLTSFTVRLPIYAAQLRPNKYSVLCSRALTRWRIFILVVSAPNVCMHNSHGAVLSGDAMSG